MTARPLAVMTPKGLLRRKQASSSIDDLATGEFQPVIDDASADRARVTRLVLCQGKIYYDIVGHEDRARATSVAVARIEQLYPFPVEQAGALLRSYPNLREVVWAQEEPRNMGAWRRSATGLKRRSPRAYRSSRRPTLAREPERGPIRLRIIASTGPDREAALAPSALSSRAS